MNTKTTTGQSGVSDFKFKLPRFDFATYAPLIALAVLVIISALASEHFLGPA